MQHKLIHFWILSTSAVGPVDSAPDGSVVDVWPIISYKVLYTVKKVIDFPVPSRDASLTKLSLVGNNLIIPDQGEFGS